MKRELALIFTIAARITSYLLVIVKPVKQVLAVIFHMKRGLTLTIIIAACVIGFLSVRGTMPFLAVYGISMEPEFQAGNLILIEKVSPYDVEVGDIIVFTIPAAIREHYNYPPTIAHRVIDVRTSETGVTFRTKGDNSGEDPFTVRPQDLRGQVSDQIPYIGLPLLFFQSQYGLIFVIVALSLLFLYLYADELGKGRQVVHKGIFAPVIAESRRSSRVIAQRMTTTEKTMESTQQALSSFASAIAEYAEHLKSHTSAIQSLSEASHELKQGAAEQNRVLERLAGVMEQPVPRMAEPPPMVKPKVDEVAHKLERVEKEEEIEGVSHEVVHKVVHKIVPVEEIAHEAERIKFPPGCVRSRQRDTKEEKIEEYRPHPTWRISPPSKVKP